MTINPTYQQVFRDQIWTYYIGDMEACKQASISAQGGGTLGGQNFTAALLTLAVIDMCAGYYHGKTTRTGHGGRQVADTTSAGDVADFMVRFFGADPQFANRAFSKKFYEVFRHGLAHTWSPKYAGVGMSMTSQSVLEIDNGIIILQALPFYGLTKNALSLYEADLGTDQALNNNFMTRYNYLLSSNRTEAQSLMTMITPPATTHFGATGPTGPSAQLSPTSAATGPQPR